MSSTSKKPFPHHHVAYLIILFIFAPSFILFLFYKGEKHDLPRNKSESTYRNAARIGMNESCLK